MLRCKLLLSSFVLLAVSGCGSSSSVNLPPSQPPPTISGWEWIAGSNNYDAHGVYGSNAGSVGPGARVGASSWVDTSGNLWIFGGYGLGANGTEGDLNDLWEYSGGQWTSMGGSTGTEQVGSYGTEGTSSATNMPGARWQAVSWTDVHGNFWLFGGLGPDVHGTRGSLNDLWRYSAGKWTWVSGSELATNAGTSGQEQVGVYGQLGTEATSNMPGARTQATGWADASGNIWLFGGLGIDSQGALGLLNDLWKYDGSAWTWMGGANVINQVGTYGTKLQSSTSNQPGARAGSLAWLDLSGNFWLFAGNGYDATGKAPGCATPPYVCNLNDLWKFDGHTWTWMSGANVTNQPGVYGTLGTAASTNVPGARSMAMGWVDPTGNFWLFGGGAVDSFGSLGDLNDLWKFDGNSWTWVGGSSVANQLGSYGAEGTVTSANNPGARDWGTAWSYNGKAFLFGGEGLTATKPTTLQDGKLNDLWEYQP